MKRTLAQFAAACGGELFGADAEFSAVLIDSRAVQAGDLFLALPGERADGHDFVAAAAQAAVGMPVVRPMPFFDRGDPRLADRWDEYMFGPDLLVAPVWKVGQRSRSVYFPKGTWRGYFQPGLVFTGPRSVDLDVPLDEILVFERDGAAVPGP